MIKLKTTNCSQRKKKGQIENFREKQALIEFLFRGDLTIFRGDLTFCVKLKTCIFICLEVFKNPILWVKIVINSFLLPSVLTLF
jgi:hypothetical protein